MPSRYQDAPWADVQGRLGASNHASTSRLKGNMGHTAPLYDSSKPSSSAWQDSQHAGIASPSSASFGSWASSDWPSSSTSSIDSRPLSSTATAALQPPIDLHYQLRATRPADKLSRAKSEDPWSQRRLAEDTIRSPTTPPADYHDPQLRSPLTRERTIRASEQARAASNRHRSTSDTAYLHRSPSSEQHGFISKPHHRSLPVNPAALVIESGRDGRDTMQFAMPNLIAPSPLRQGEREMLQALGLGDGDSDGSSTEPRPTLARAIRRTSTDFASSAAKATAKGVLGLAHLRRKSGGGSSGETFVTSSCSPSPQPRTPLVDQFAGPSRPRTPTTPSDLTQSVDSIDFTHAPSPRTPPRTPPRNIFRDLRKSPRRGSRDLSHSRRSSHSGGDLPTIGETAAGAPAGTTEASSSTDEHVAAPSLTGRLFRRRAATQAGPEALAAWQRLPRRGSVSSAVVIESAPVSPAPSLARLSQHEKSEHELWQAARSPPLSAPHSARRSWFSKSLYRDASPNDAITMLAPSNSDASNVAPFAGGEGGGGWGHGGGMGSGGGGGGGGGGGRTHGLGGGSGGGANGGGGGRNPGGGGGGGGRAVARNGQDNGPSVTSLFKKLELVGRGAYGAVYRGVNLASGSAVALKIVNLDTPDDDVSDIQREVALLSQLREAEQKNVVRYWGCWLKGPELWIVMDYAEGGSVRTLMRTGPIAEQHAVIIVRETLVALSYLHKAGVIHRDIKAANILLTNQGKILLCDFGVAASLVSTAAKRTTFVGTPYWMAPEVITTGKSYDQSADIWSLGITIYEMVTGNPPLADQEQMRAIMLIPKNKPPRLPTDKDFSLQMREFVSSCLNEEAKERPNADELSKTKWIKSSAKTSTALLKDLIAAYTSWIKAGGMRMSLLGAETADLDAAGRDSFAFDDMDGDGEWQFDQRDTMDGAALAAPSRDHPLARLFQQEGEESEDSGGGIESTLAKLDAASIRPAPPPPVQAAPPPKDDDEDELLPPPPIPAAAEDVQRPSTPTNNAAAAESKPSFAGMGAMPFRFGTPTDNVAPQQRRNDSPSKTTPRAPARTQSATSSPAGGEAMSLPPSKSAVARQDVGDAEAMPPPGANVFTSAQLSSSPVDRHAQLPHSRQHSRQQSTTSAHSVQSHGGSRYHQRMPSGPPSPLGGSGPSSHGHGHGLGGSSMGGDLPRPWMTATGRSRGGSSGSQSSDQGPAGSAAIPAMPSPMSGGIGGVSTSSNGAAVPATTAAGASPSVWQPVQPSLLGPRGRSGSRSRAGPGSDMGMMPPPPPPPPASAGAVGMMMSTSASSFSSASSSVAANTPRTTARDQLARMQSSTSATHLAPETNSDLLPPSPGAGPGRARTGSTTTRPSPLSAGGSASAAAAIHHQRRQHGGSDPTTSSRPNAIDEEGEESGIVASSASINGLPTLAQAAGAAGAAAAAAPLSIAPLDLSALRGKDDVHAHLERTVDELARWLDALAGSLAA